MKDHIYKTVIEIKKRAIYIVGPHPNLAIKVEHSPSKDDHAH